MNYLFVDKVRDKVRDKVNVKVRSFNSELNNKKKMQKIEKILYAPEYGFRGEADLWLPERPAEAKAVLLIHGGGWNAMDRFAFEPVARLMVEMGLAVFNINYRLLDDAPWPACGDDCIRAGKFLLEANHPEMKQLDLDKIIVAGGSAGGHLAMMTGLRLPEERVSAIISMAGPADLLKRFTENKDLKGRLPIFFGKEDFTEKDLMAASPVSYINADSPDLYCLQSVNDQLVVPAQSESAVAKSQSCGTKAELIEFDGPGDSHGFWQEGESDWSKRKFDPGFEQVLREVIEKVR